MTEVKRLDLGAVSAYALAVEKGYRGTEEEFVEILTNALNYATQAQESASAAAGSAEEAGRYKTQAGEILASVNLAGTQQIEAIESAGTQQTNAAKEAIEAKGKETLDSIPDSYEALQGDVTQLRGDLNNYFGDNLANDDGKLYPVYIKANSYVTTSTSNGENAPNSSDIVLLYNKDRVLTQRFSALLPGTNKRTVLVVDDVYFIQINKVNASYSIKIELGDKKTEYKDYDNSPILSGLAISHSVEHYIRYDILSLGNMESGGIGNNGYNYEGDTSYQNNHARFANRLYIDAPIVVKCSSDIRMKVFLYDDYFSYTNVTSSDWVKEYCFNGKSDKYVRIAFVGINILDNLNKINVSTLYDFAIPDIKTSQRIDFKYRIGSLSSGSFVYQDYEPRIVCVDYIHIGRFFSKFCYTVTFSLHHLLHGLCFV